MATPRFAFSALLKKVNPDPASSETAQQLPGEVRDWLKEHDYETDPPHSRLIGSYGRSTAIADIKDVDTLLFLPQDSLERTPESVLRELKAVLEEYPDATAETSPQRRSIRLDFPDQGLCMDIVGCVADEGLEKPLWIPDRQKTEWIRSDPLGYGRALSQANAEHGQKLVPLIKLVKAWRDEHMVYRRPKSYLLEVIVFQAVTGGGVVLKERSTAQNFHDLLEHIEQKWEKLMDDGEGVPRVLDPQLQTVITAGWERTHFETFMRRIRESAGAARLAMEADSDDAADTYWAKVFGDLWPTPEEIAAEAQNAATEAVPGKAYVNSAGAVGSTASAGAVKSRPTTFHGTSS